MFWVRRFGSLALAIAGLLTAGGLRAEETRVAVEATLATLLEAYLGRPLAAPEAAAAARDFVAYFGDPDCRGDCAVALQSHLANAEAFAARPDDPRTLLLRQGYVRQSVFPARPLGPTLARLLQEPDPPAIVNPATQRLMTRRDLAALPALVALAEGGESAAKPLSPAEMAELEAALEPIFGRAARRLPLRLVLAGEILASIGQAGNAISPAEERQLARYVTGAPDAQFPNDLLGRTLGLGPAELAELREADATDRAFAAFWQKLDRDLSALGRLTVDKALLDALRTTVP